MVVSPSYLLVLVENTNVVLYVLYVLYGPSGRLGVRAMPIPKRYTFIVVSPSYLHKGI